MDSREADVITFGIPMEWRDQENYVDQEFLYGESWQKEKYEGHCLPKSEIRNTQYYIYVYQTVLSIYNLHQL